MKCGLLGRKLGHSYSPQIHARLGSYSYELFEKEPDEVADFLKSGQFSAINVTIPYKKIVIPFCTELSDTARQVGAVNTLVRRSDGSLVGHNTDYFGFVSTVCRVGLNPSGKKVLVIGSGGVSNPVVAALQRMNAKTVVISHRENTPENLAQHSDAAILVNATPVGMYPNVGASPVNLDLFPHLEGVLELIFNPSRTQLLLDAEKRGLKTENGLWMLVAQAKESSEWFTGSNLPEELIPAIHWELKVQMENIILVGMPGCGKTTVGKCLARRLGRPFVDTDAEIEQAAGASIPDIFSVQGEEGFRALETQVLSRLGKQSGLVLATGGGCVTRGENYPLLHQNGTIFFLTRDLNQLCINGRPLSQKGNLADMYRVRLPMYRRFADFTVGNDSTPEQAVEKILSQLK